MSGLLKRDAARAALFLLLIQLLIDPFLERIQCLDPGVKNPPIHKDGRSSHHVCIDGVLHVLLNVFLVLRISQALFEGVHIKTEFSGKLDETLRAEPGHVLHDLIMVFPVLVLLSRSQGSDRCLTRKGMALYRTVFVYEFHFCGKLLQHLLE